MKKAYRSHIKKRSSIMSSLLGKDSQWLSSILESCSIMEMALRKIGTKQESGGKEQHSVGTNEPLKIFNSWTKKKKKHANALKR